MINGIEAFIVGSVDNLGAGRWKIAGRACEVICVGDILRYDLRSTAGNNKLQVLSVTSYNKELSTIYKMMTGSILVSGAKEDNLESVKMLFLRGVDNV
ncbi:hypothetical protein ACFPES_21405 [Paenibacillus sp. GCM10023248]|uniref:hypothetical protein n=1 Tax=Bacillales TaxID=1385 RepID=UPI002377F0C9|nr:MULTISPECIES: hypothetical protein [Bacillales]MDD9269615.1 hypothetical protein [Paenibacillus sp. MAHUQ-63]MDR6880750.1 hypothetical protein [Bacillus sp. 3255]